MVYIRAIPKQQIAFNTYVNRWYYVSGIKYNLILKIFAIIFTLIY